MTKKGRKGISEESIMKMVELYKEGNNIYDIAKEVGCSGASVYNLLRAKGLIDRQSRVKKKRQFVARINGKDMVPDMPGIFKMRHEGYPWPMIARKYQVSNDNLMRNAVWRYCEHFGLPYPIKNHQGEVNHPKLDQVH